MYCCLCILEEVVINLFGRLHLIGTSSSDGCLCLFVRIYLLVRSLW